MERVILSELNMRTRNDALIFLKTLWRNEKPICPICGYKLSLLHLKNKKNYNDWVCKKCNKIYKALSLLDELNEQMPN